MSESEYFHYRQNWWISLKKSGNITEPLRKRSDFNQALSTLNGLHQESGGRQLRPMPYWKYKQWHLPPVGGNGVDPDSLPQRTGEPVVYRSLGKTSDERLPRIYFIVLFFVADRSCTADGGLL